jgi:hypothetical protein
MRVIFIRILAGWLVCRCHVDVPARALRVFRVEMPPPLVRDADGPDGCR